MHGEAADQGNTVLGLGHGRGEAERKLKGGAGSL